MLSPGSLVKPCCKAIIICAVLAVGVNLSLLAAQEGAPASDTTALAADSTTAADTTAALAADTTALAADSTAPAPTAKVAVDTTAKPKKKPRPPGDRVEALIIPWDWDEYTNVIEVGLKRDDGREYTLTENEFYQVVFDNLGLKVLAIGKVARDSEGFYNMTVEYIEPADSLQNLATEKGRRP